MSLSEPPDLLISDVRMPQLSDIDLAIQIREQCPMCKILLFSAQAWTTDLLAVARKQGHDFHLLSQPSNPSDLLRLIKEHAPGRCFANDPTVPTMVLERPVPPSVASEKWSESVRQSFREILTTFNASLGSLYV